MNVLDSKEPSKVPSFEYYFNIQNIFTLLYKEICYQKLYLSSPGPLHVYSGAVKNDHLTIKDYYVHVYFTTLVLICMQI